MNMNIKLIVVLGRLCSGKGTYCVPFIKQGYHHITTSDIVKQVSGKQTRSDLQTTKNLDQQIAQELITQIQQHPFVIVDGIRQLSILQTIEKTFPHVQIVWLDVDEQTRKQRFERRKDRKDNISFDQAERGDDEMGLSQVEHIYKDRYRI